jgi:phosphoribosylformimino-5-aminoimidazole carboxamide ribotide isomerase
MQVLPVLDLLHGIVVRGVGGRRDEYQPVKSRLVDKPDPHSVARAFREQLGLTRLYIADLDAILFEQPNLEIYRSLSQEGFELLVDAGLRNIESAGPIASAGVTQLIAGLETWPGPDELSQLCAAVGPDRVIFSLDLKNGRPIGDLQRWHTSDAFEIGCRAVRAGVAGVIVLDLVQVGSGAGVATIDLCRRLMSQFRGLPVITGGGVRAANDLLRLQEVGIEGALVASSLHNGCIGRVELNLT